MQYTSQAAGKACTNRTRTSPLTIRQTRDKKRCELARRTHRLPVSKGMSTGETMSTSSSLSGCAAHTFDMGLWNCAPLCSNTAIYIKLARSVSPTLACYACSVLAFMLVRHRPFNMQLNNENGEERFLNVFFVHFQTCLSKGLTQLREVRSLCRHQPTQVII